MLRAATSMDPDMKALALAMFANGGLRLKDLERRAQLIPARILEATYVDEIMRRL